MDKINEYAKYLGVNEEILYWINSAGKKAINRRKIQESDLEHVLDFFVSLKGPKKLRRMSVDDALRLSKKWSIGNQKRGRNLTDSEEDTEIIHDFLDGNKIVKLLTKKSLEREGFLMNHCVGGYSVNSDLQIYSYRDNKNTPHATFEVRKNGEEIVQIKGKGNGPIHPKYIHPILQFLKSIDVDIRPNDMKNLGYYVVEDSVAEFLKNYVDVNKHMTVINNIKYIHD